MQQKARINRTIKIYRTDVEKMKTQIRQRMSDIWYIHHRQVTEEYLYGCPYGELYSTDNIWLEILRANHLYLQTDIMLFNEDFDFIEVDADEWFSAWSFAEYIKEGPIDRYYMFPDSDEVDEIFETMKSDYRFIVTDVFRFFRFYPISEDVVIA